MVKLARHPFAFAAAGTFIGVALAALTIGAAPKVTQHPPADVGARRPVTVITHCVYYSADVANLFRTEVKGIEVSGRNDLQLAIGVPCSDVISELSSLGFAIVNSISAVGDYNGDGLSDYSDFAIWKD
jgi:hypothetical protein